MVMFVTVMRDADPSTPMKLLKPVRSRFRTQEPIAQEETVIALPLQVFPPSRTPEHVGMTRMLRFSTPISAGCVGRVNVVIAIEVMILLVAISESVNGTPSDISLPEMDAIRRGC